MKLFPKGDRVRRITILLSQGFWTALWSWYWGWNHPLIGMMGVALSFSVVVTCLFRWVAPDLEVKPCCVMCGAIDIRLKIWMEDSYCETCFAAPGRERFYEEYRSYFHVVRPFDKNFRRKLW